MKIAAIQMSSTDQVEDNLKTIERWVMEAAIRGASLVVLPENVAFMGKTEIDKLKIAEKFGTGLIQDFLANLARKLEIWLVGGTIPILVEEGQGQGQSQSYDPNRVYSTSLVWNNEGNIVARYDKIHLFDVQVQLKIEEYVESRTICPGNEDNIVTVDSPLGKLGLSICYDLRFPELYRVLFAQGAEIMLVPSAFTAITGQAHWEPLLRARAIENFSYVLAPNQTGVHANGRTTYGHSMIVDPWGKILAECSEGEGIVMAEIDLNYLNDLRRRFPVASHRRIVF